MSHPYLFWMDHSNWAQLACRWEVSGEVFYCNGDFDVTKHVLQKWQTLKKNQNKFQWHLVILFTAEVRMKCFHRQSFNNYLYFQHSYSFPYFHLVLNKKRITVNDLSLKCFKLRFKAYPNQHIQIQQFLYCNCASCQSYQTVPLVFLVKLYPQTNLSQLYNMSKDIESKVVKQQVIYQGKWLGLKYVDYTIGYKTVNNYQKIFKTTQIKGRVSSVDIIPIIKYKNKKSEILMNMEFRAPVSGYTLEFPTGTTEDQNYEENARRQMLEQTGYVVDSFVKMPMPVLYYDPWKSDQDTLLYIAIIDGDNPKCFSGQQLQHDQDIRSVKFQLNENLLQTIVEYVKKNQLHMESKVYSLCMGLWLKNNLQSL